MSADALLAERAATHGDADVTGTTYARLRRDIGEISDPNLEAGVSVALRYPIDMILVKLARIACGDATHADHWADIAGYAEMARRMVAK